MNPFETYVKQETRRQFFGRGAMGLGVAALAMLDGQSTLANSAGPNLASGPVGNDLPHFAGKAKRAIYLFMSGAPSQQDMYDYKPKMQKLFDTELPDSIRKGQRLTTMTSGQTRFPVAPSKFNFKKYDNGADGMWVSELLPHTSKIVGELSFVRSVWTEAINHDPAITYICTGNQLPGRASLGAWLSYGLGSENANLPSFVVLNSTWSAKRDAQALYNRLWGNGFLPSRHQGVLLRNDGDWNFTDVTITSGLDENNRRWSLAASWEDYDDDGDVDLYVAHDFGRNTLYRNDGGHFTDIAPEAGVEDIAAGMSVSWADFGHDGRMGLYVGNMFSSAGLRITGQSRFQSRATSTIRGEFRRHARGNSLFRNTGDDRFEDVSEDAGVTIGRWAWGSKFVDLNNDGWEDLVVANGFVTGHETKDL